MANDKQYRVTVGGESQLWDADKYERNKDKLTSSYPDAKVEEIGYMSANEEQVIPGEKYRVTIGDEQQEWDSDKLNRNKGHLLQQYPDAKIERLGVIGSQNQPEQNDNIETNFFKGLHQTNKNIWNAGIKSLIGEAANLFTGSGREEKAALNDIEYLESIGEDPMAYISRQIQDFEFEKQYGMSREEFEKLDGNQKKQLVYRYDPKAFEDLAIQRKNKESVIKAYQDALEQAGGDLDKAKEILREKSQPTWGDKLIEQAGEIVAENKELQGAAKWGGLAASAIPSAAALVLAALTKGRTKGLSKWLSRAAKGTGHIGMAGMSAGTAGLSMIEAREHGATNWQTWATGLADGLIEYITEKIPFDKLTKPVIAATKTKTTKALMDAMRKADGPGRKELEKLLTEANKKLGGKLLNGKNVADWLGNVAAEGLSEASAEALQTMTSMIYLNPEEYPTFGEIMSNAWEGAKGGFALGGILGGAGKAVEHSLNKDRRKQQGFVNVALVEQEGKSPFVAELVDYDPETKTYKALQDGEIVDVKEDEIQYKHQYTYNEFESGRYRQLEDEAIADGTVSDAQVAVSADRLGNARQKLENLMTQAGMTDEQKNATFADLEAGDIPGFAEDAKALWDAADEYSEAFKRDKDIQSARNVKAENERKAVLDAMTQQMGGEFWQKGSRTMQENGTEIIEPAMVEIGTMQDGKQVFILSTPNDNGEVSAITEDGKKIFIRHTDLQDGTTIMPLEEYLNARVVEQKKSAEQARMMKEAAPQLDAIRQKYQMGVQVNLGTEDSPTPGVVVGIKPENDGVFIQTQSGVIPYTFEQLADIEGTPIRVMTDAQLSAAEAAEIEAAESARMTELANTSEQMTDAETVGDNAVQMEGMATETPLPTNPDGSVNQDALFKESPARWAEWNDERRQDGGESSAQYISGKLTKAQARLAELQTAYGVEDSLNKKELLEKAVIEQQAVVDELAGVMQRYAPAEQAPMQAESVQSAPVATQQERTTESVLASLSDGSLTDEEIRANIDANLAEAQKAYDKYAKKAPKMGTDKDAYLAEKQKYEQGLPALQQEIDFWNGVKQTYEGAMQQDVLPTEESFRPELTEEDMQPHTPQELAARELGLKEGGIKLLWDSVSAHTGFGNGERQKFFGIFRSKDKGGMTIEAAGERLMEIDREYDLGLFDQSDPMAGVNAILDVLGDTQTIGDLRNYIANNREAQVAREAAAAFSAMNAEFEATHGMTMQEWAHAEEVARKEDMRFGLTNEQANELNSIFAEEQYQYGTNEQSTGIEGLSGGESQEDAGNAVGGIQGVYQNGNQVLSGTQSSIGRGETISEGQAEDNVSEGDIQDGDTSVYGSEQAAEVDDLPPAYRGVKRAKEDAVHVVNPLAMTVETRLKIMAETREAIHERVNTWSDKLGIKINIIDNYRDVQNKDAKENIKKGNPTYGWFEKSTGEIFIYVPDYLNFRTETALKEVEKTILHEGIAHKGMREMLGEEKYGELCDKVWNEMMTDKQRKEFIKYPGVNGNTRAAADEFIASVSENVKQDTVWDKIANFFKDILNSIGIETKVADDDLKGLLKQSYRRYRKGEAKTNPGSNQQAEGNTSLRSANGSLVGMHNISEDKLRKVLKQGGLANPSTAVVNIAEYLLDGYGDISLIMPSSLVDANTGDNIGTYTGDAWTPTYPPISRKVDAKGWKVIKDLIRSVVSEDSPLYHDIINGLENYLEDNRSSKMEFVFLKEKGIEPEIAYKGADGFVGMRNLEAVLGVQGLRDGVESYERYKNASRMAKRSFNMWLDAAGNKQAHKELKEQLKKEPRLAEVLKLNEDVSFAAFDSFTYDIFRKEQDAGKIDTYDTMGAAARYVDANNLRGEFEAWLESLMEQAGAKEVFFAGYTRDGDRIYKDNTLENVSRHMRLQGRANAYDDHGLSATKSALLQRLTSLSQIRKNKARLQNESAYNKEYDALKDRLWSIISQLADMQEISSNQFMNVDYAESRLQESFTKKNPIVHLNKEYGYDIDPAGEYAEELNSFIKDVQQMPAKYFETKFERPVYLNEFAAAVMPTTTSEDIKQAVSEAGLPIFEYDSEVEGSRKEATLKATEGEGIRFRTLGEKGAANLDKAEEATIRLDNLGVARQMEEAGKDAKAIKLATGWERGADNLWRYEVADDFDLTELENRLQENLNDGLSKTWGVLYPSDLGDLTKSYPDFNVDIMVWVGDEFENTGEYSPATEGDETTFGRSASIEVKAKTVADIKDVLVHEIQHAIQEKEGFAEGGSVFGLKDKLSAELDKRVARIKELRAEGRDAEADELMRMSKGLADAVINNDADTYQNYRKLAGEVEARNISARLGMSEQERRESLLSETEDVAREDQIVLMEGQTMFRAKHPQEFTRQFMEGAVDDFYSTYNTAAPASVVYVKNRRMVEDALGFGKGEMPDWLYERVKEEAKGSGAYLVNMQFQKEDGTAESWRRILIFAKDDINMSADVDRIIFHENTHGWILDHPELLELGKWLSQSDDKTIQRVVGWVKDAYKEESWANEMLSDYVGRMLSIGNGQRALDLIPDEYKPILNEIYEKFGYRPEQEDGRRIAELISDASGIQMRDSELGEPGSNKTLFKTGISPEVRKEMDVISATAIVNGNYMKAPNGKDSKLTPEQWAMVRTKNFKNWFGDWENDPENASKVVDENGEPKVVYHQTNAVVYINRETGENWDELGWKEKMEWDERDDWEDYWEEQDFNTFSRVNARTTIEFDGFFFAPEYDENHEYGDRTIAAFVNIKNPASREDYHIDSRYNDAGRNERIRLQEAGFDGVIRMDGDNVDEYIAFEPNQIKSATDNTGEFSESEDIRFRFIGMKGAANIDKATQQTWMLDSLKRAQQMESKFDAKTIKRATGWEKGVDGKWRYEEPDNITLKEDKVQELYDNYEFNKRKVNSGEAGDWKEESCLLPELIDAPELFRAYPELKKCRVRLTDRGFGTSWGGTIDLNYGFFASSAGRYGYKSIKGVLLHELQHEIQEIEGFARGGNIDTADQIKRNAAVWAWKLRAEEVAKEHPEFKKSDVKEFLEDEFEGIGQYDWRANKGAFDEGTRIYTLGLSGGKTLAKDYKLLASIDESDYETYYRLAGEVEARNVTDRAKMSYAERKYRLASETEDRDRDLQLVRGVTPDETTMFKTRTKPAPTKTQDVYKLMRLGADGKLYPLFIGSAEPIELGTWYDAESPNLGDLTKLASGVHLVNNETGEAMTLDEFKAQHPEINIKGKRPNVAAINWATENGARWIEIEDKATAQRRYEGESRSYYNLGINGSGQVGQFAMRPGWHAGSLPTMRQIGKGKDKNLRDDSFVWVKGRIPADVDYQAEADANPDKDIPTHIPTDGFYMKATNANAKASQADKMGWYVAGSFIADEIISDAEARSVIDSWNAEHPDAQVEYDYERESGREYDPKRGGLVEKEGTTLFKTTGTPTEQVVKDGLILSIEDFTNLAGNIFSAMPEDIRRKVVENAARTDYDLKKATLQMSARLAEKRELTDEEIELAKMVAQKVEDAVLASGVEMTRPFTTNEALWMLYQSTNPTSEYDLIGNARKAVVANNLGMSQSQQAEQEKDADNIRFRSARGAASNSAAAMYNNEQRSAWGMLRETYQDMYRSVKNLVQAIEKATGKDAQSWENILTSLNALSSKNLADKKKYLRDFLTPMWDAALAIRDKYHKSLEQIERYLMVKHGLERNKVLAARDARNFYREQADQEIAAIKADKSLSKAEQKARIQKVEDTYDNHVSDIEAGIDVKFQEFRAKDYGGLTALFSDFADYGTREDYESEELYQEAALAARTPKYATLAETELAAQQEVDAFETEVDKALVDNLWKRINAATKETLRHQYANNMLTKEQFERVRDMFEFYVPLRGFVDTTAEDTYSYYVSGQQSKFANPLQGAKGRKTQAETPLGWIGSMAESAIQMDNKNTAKLALYYFAVNRPNNDVLKITPTWYEWTGEVDADGKKIFEPVYPTFNGPQSGPAMQAQMDAFESMMEQQAQAGNAYKGKQRIDLKEAVIRAPKSAPEHVVTVKVAGEDYSIIINANPRAAQAINGMLNIDKGDNPLYRAARALLRFQASIKTSLAPLFWITNFMRDMSFAFINTSIRNDVGYTKEFAKNYPHAFRVFSYVHKNRKSALGNTKYEKYYTEFAENGGITGYTSLTNNTEYDQMMKAYAKNARAGKFIKGIKGAFEFYQNVGESFEQVSRFAAYITAREAGKDISESIYEAKEVTINFNRKGSGKAITREESGKMRRKNGKPLTDAERIFFVTLGGLSPVARSLFMFFNAGMQGVRMIAKLAKEHPGKSAAWAGIVFTMGLVNAIMHALAEDDDEYLDMPDYVRRTNILIGKNGTYFKWSLPHEVRPFYAMADIFVQHAMGRKPNENIAAELAETFGEWVPINPFKDGMNAFTPDIIRPFVEIKNNKDFTGSPIYREYRWLTEEQQKNMPAYEKGFDSTSKVLVDISEILNDVSGGDHTDAGFININPAVVEHLAQEYGGGPLKLAEQFFKTIGVMTGDQEFSIRNTPFLSTFMVAADDRYRNAHTTELFKYYKGMADDVKRRAGEYKADKDKEGFDKLRASDDFQIFQIYRKYEKRDKLYNEQLKRAKSDSERKDIMSLQDAHRKRMIEEISKL